MELFVTKLKGWTQLNFAKKELHLRFCCSPKYDPVFVYQKNNVQILHEMLLKVCFNVFLITSFWKVQNWNILCNHPWVALHFYCNYWILHIRNLPVLLWIIIIKILFPTFSVSIMSKWFSSRFIKNMQQNVSFCYINGSLYPRALRNTGNRQVAIPKACSTTHLARDAL